MRAVRMHTLGGPEVLCYEDVPDPQAGAGEVLVIAAGTFEEDGQSHCAQLPLFTSIVQSTGQCVRIRPENGTNDPFDMLFKDGSTDSALIIGDSKKVLTQMPEGVFQTCVTSPPYWSLRNYNIPGQVSLELSLNGYIQNVVEVFEQVRRALWDDGTLWLNIGDPYTSGGRTWRAPDKKNPHPCHGYSPSDARRLETPRPHRRAVAISIRTANGGMVSSRRHHLEQT